MQGYELETFKGMFNGFAKILTYLYRMLLRGTLSWPGLSDEVLEFLGDRDFNLVGIYNPHYNSRGMAIQADFLFKNKLCES